MAEDNDSINTPPPNAPTPFISPSENPNSPYFLYYNDNSHTMIITPSLTGSNHLTWHRSFTLAISIKNRMGFLDGSILTPNLAYSLYVPWLHCNNLILSWILNSISKEIASNVFYISFANEVWEKLKTHFAQPDNVRIFQLQQQLSTIVQGTQMVSEYFTQLNGVWEELHNYRPLPCCSCGLCTCKALNSVGDIQQSNYVFKFLMGLNDSYETIKGQIIPMSPIPSLDKTFSLVLQEERQRQTKSLVLPASESSTLATQFKRKEQSDMTCQHCGKAGHTQEKCYRLIGFPPNFKFTKTRPGYSNNSSSGYHLANQVISQDQGKGCLESPQLSLTQDQVQKLLALVHGQSLQPSRNHPYTP
ncbi:uncharacterized protein LOC122282449 [Carya illinoinensis]|uniref:uncharacterized protein LOC122282449 n=1 Tax=Carya illinoinensis TaxID=32201 RepID=UPI001C71B78F|nr:uncharacterized protein LOC122282449 [Carya illinoinensis]